MHSRKLIHNIEGAFRWIVTYDHFSWSRCIRKQSFQTLDEAIEFKNSVNFSRPVCVYRCKYCGLYHIGSNQDIGDRHVWFGNRLYMLDSHYTDQKEAITRGHSLHKNGFNYRIRTYNKPLYRKGVFYVYKECEQSPP